MTISPEEISRLRPRAGVIAQSLRPEAPVARTADGLRIGRKGSLSITVDTGGSTTRPEREGATRCR